MNQLTGIAETKGRALVLTIFLFLSISSIGVFNQDRLPQEPCNGLADNCDKLYTEVTYPETHNAHSSLDEDYNYLAANHRLNLSQQWDAGYRAFMLDIHHSR